MDISWWCASSYRPELLPELFRELKAKRPEKEELMAKRPEKEELRAKRPEKKSETLHQITCAGLFDKGVFVECQETPLGKAGK